MKEQESTVVSPSPAELKRVLFLGVILASFMVCFIVLGGITYADISNLRRELREMKAREILNFPENFPGNSEDLEQSDGDVDIDTGIPDWVPSFPVLGYEPSPPSNKSRERVRRNAKGGDTGRSKSHVGHFIGTNKLGKCDNVFWHGKKFALATETGDICAWEYASWMEDEGKKQYDLQPNGKVKVRDGGMYYVYGQLIIYDSKPLASMGIMIRDYTPDKNGKQRARGVERELAKCIETAGYLIGEHGIIADESGSFRTCNMGSVTELYNGSEVYLIVHVPKTSHGFSIPVKTFHNVTTAFFGMIKYT